MGTLLVCAVGDSFDGQGQTEPGLWCCVQGHSWSGAGESKGKTNVQGKRAALMLN